MYINLQAFRKSGILQDDLLKLVAIKQKDLEYLLDYVEDSDLERYKSFGFIDNVKVKKPTEHPFVSVRISSAGNKLLDKMSFQGSTDEDDEKVLNWLVSVYKNKKGGIVKNKQETLRRIHWFKSTTSIEKNKLAVLLQCFLQDTYEDSAGESVRDFMERNPRGVLSNMLDKVFWSEPNVFARNYKLSESPLWIYYDDNREYIEGIWESKNL